MRVNIFFFLTLRKTKIYLQMYKEPDKTYDQNLTVDAEYIKNLPDLQNGDTIQGARVKIQRVGISNFKIPLLYNTKEGGKITLETSVTGTVSLDAEKKGINMSRIMRTFYDHQRKNPNSETSLEEVLKSYRKDLDTFEADIVLRFSYPIIQKSLRSNLEGWQYYDIAVESRINRDGEVSKYIHFDFVYSSACPCSYELGQHAVQHRNKAVVSHSQRSIARLSLKINSLVLFEEIKDLCLEALKTETQVMVKREDEQAFAELNGSYLKFVEDSCRLLYEVFVKDSRIDDFRIVCSHMESLHSHDAIGVIVKGVEGGFDSDVEHSVFNTLAFGK